MCKLVIFFPARTELSALFLSPPLSFRIFQDRSAFSRSSLLNFMILLSFLMVQICLRMSPTLSQHQLRHHLRQQILQWVTPETPLVAVLCHLRHHPGHHHQLSPASYLHQPRPTGLVAVAVADLFHLHLPSHLPLCPFSSLAPPLQSFPGHRSRTASAMFR